MRIPIPTDEQLARCRKDPGKPPTFRGSDFTMRWEQGRWSEDRIIESINATSAYRAIPYGRSQVGPASKDEIPAYWREYAAAESHGKRPDILVIKREDHAWAREILGSDPTRAGEDRFAPVVARAVCGIEAENSLWVADRMPDLNTAVPLSRLRNTSPNIWVKDQDLPCLTCWMHYHRKPVIVVQVFYDVAYAVGLLDVLQKVDRIQSVKKTEQAALQKELGVVLRKQNYADARTGTAETKLVYLTHHSVATVFGKLEGQVTTRAQVIFEPNGKVLPYVTFEGGRLAITQEGLTLLANNHDMAFEST